MPMIDVSMKHVTKRAAQATGYIRLPATAMEAVIHKTNPKGDVLQIAEIAAIQAAKNCSLLLPLCHPLPLDAISVTFDLLENVVVVTVQVTCFAKTGVEMEALVAVQAALLCIYDLSKILSPCIELGGTKLDWKYGGKHGLWVHPDYNGATPIIPGQKATDLSGKKVLVVTLSDRAYSGVYADTSGATLTELLKEMHATDVEYILLPDTPEELQRIIQSSMSFDLIVTNGGTGISPRDRTPDTLEAMFERKIDGIGELLRYSGSLHTPLSWASRATAGQIGKTLILALPGRESAVRESINALQILLPHLVAVSGSSS